MNRRAFCAILPTAAVLRAAGIENSPRERISLNADWRFQKGDPKGVDSNDLLYDVRPEQTAADNRERPAEFTEAAVALGSARRPVLKPLILPTGNRFLGNTARQFVRPDGNPGGNLSCVQHDFDDSGWRQVNLPHDWAIEGLVP